MESYKKYWLAVVAVLLIGFGFLGYWGRDVYHEAPPVPTAYVTSSGETLFTKDDILHGQTAWQTTGGQEVGTVLGHGAYQAPDWTADWLHREITEWLDLAAQDQYGVPYEALSDSQQAALRQELHDEYRGAQVDENGVVVLSDRRVQAMNDTADYYIRLYGDDPTLHMSRDHFAMKNNTLPDLQDRIDMTHFFFWTSWIASAQRPGADSTYTANWPHEPLLGNVPTTENVIWSIASIVSLLLGIGLFVWFWAFCRNKKEDPVTLKPADPILKMSLTPSQKALWKYALVVMCLFMLQLMCGGLVAHYTVEGQSFYGIPLGEWIPYSVVRTWHLQLAMFWIAVAFLTMGLFLAPLMNGGKDPKYQKLGVNILFVALVTLVLGALGGSYLAIYHILPEQWSFYLGHQGYEYLDLGRIWQAIEYIGILFWLLLMLRSAVQALRQPGDKHLTIAFIFSVVMVGLFYGPGLMYGEHTNLAIMEYWRWWVVHLWVEGFFEVFSTAVMAYIFVTLGLISRRTGTVSAILAGAIYLIGGIPGTFHHLYYTGVTTGVIATGAVFSALEVAPLAIIGYEAYEHYRLQYATPWMHRLKWPIMCFVAVAFWNMIGAGVLGYLVNTPLALYYVQGLNMTPTHAHAALFGVYGFLSLGFVFFVMRYIRPDIPFNDRLMKVGFWCLNIGLALMLLLSLIPVGILQSLASIQYGLWFARSESFMQEPLLQVLRWMRMLGDTIFIIGATCFFAQVVMMLKGKAHK